MAFEIKKNDRRPHYRVQLTSNGLPVNLTAAAGVKFYMRTLAANATMKVNGDAAFIDKINGIVEYAWQPGDTDTSGSYVIEFEVNWGGSPSELQTFPSSGYFTATINDDLV